MNGCFRAVRALTAAVRFFFSAPVFAAVVRFFVVLLCFMEVASGSAQCQIFPQCGRSPLRCPVHK